MKVKRRETVAEYLTYLEDKGIEIGYFELHEIKDIDKSCCSNATTKVIDFDKTKEIIVDSESLVSTKSCDCLKICPNRESIDLIEMKGFSKFIEYFRGAKIDEKIDDTVKKYDLKKKIEDSLHLLDTIVRKKEFGRTNEDAQFFSDTKINYILLTDVDSINSGLNNYFTFALYFLATHSNSPESYITSKLENELTKLPNISYKLNKPVLKTCSEIDAFYV